MNGPDTRLFGISAADYGDTYKQDYLAMFLDYVASADRISERRHTTNNFFLTINTALVGITGFFAQDAGKLIWVAALAGLAFSLTWMVIIQSYRSLNTAKFKVIHQLEKNLPFAAYDEEWILLKQGKKGSVHRPFGKVEVLVPWIFIVLHGVVVFVNVQS